MPIIINENKLHITDHNSQKHVLHFQCKSECQKNFSMQRIISPLLGLLNVQYMRYKLIFQYWVLFKAHLIFSSPY